MELSVCRCVCVCAHVFRPLLSFRFFSAPGKSWRRCTTIQKQVYYASSGISLSARRDLRSPTPQGSLPCGRTGISAFLHSYLRQTCKESKPQLIVTTILAGHRRAFAKDSSCPCCWLDDLRHLGIIMPVMHIIS